MARLNRTQSTYLLAGCAILAACSGKPLPADKSTYAGTWRADGMDLTISPDGGCSYARVSGDGHVSVNGPIRGFEGDDFVVGVPLINTTFDVTAPPTERDGVWTMTVDGVALTRVSP